MCEGEEQVFSSKLNSQGKFWKTLKKTKNISCATFRRSKKKCEGDEKWRAKKKEVWGYRKMKSKKKRSVRVEKNEEQKKKKCAVIENWRAKSKKKEEE